MCVQCLINVDDFQCVVLDATTATKINSTPAASSVLNGLKRKEKKNSAALQKQEGTIIKLFLYKSIALAWNLHPFLSCGFIFSFHLCGFICNRMHLHRMRYRNVSSTQIVIDSHVRFPVVFARGRRPINNIYFHLIERRWIS